MKKKLTPKETIKNYLECWKQEKYRKIAKTLTVTYRGRHSYESIKYIHKGRKLVAYEIIKIEDVAPACKDVYVNMSFDVNGKTVTYGARIRLVQEIASYQPSVNGVWGVNPISALKKYPVIKSPKKTSKKKGAKSGKKSNSK